MPKIQKGLKTKQLIVDKSLNLFSVKGYFNTSINDIMQETKLSKGGLYAHFKSKEAIWYATYDNAISTWKHVIFEDIKNITCPLERLNVLIEKHLNEYIGRNTFEGGGFFLNMLIEFSGQNETITNHLLKGFNQYAFLIGSWIEEAKGKNLIKVNADSEEIGNFIVSSFYGTTALYAASKQHKILQQTVSQLHYFVNSLKKHTCVNATSGHEPIN